MKCRNRGVTCVLNFMIIMTFASLLTYVAVHIDADAGLTYFKLIGAMVILLQPLALVIIVILLACRIHSVYKGAAKMRMIWLHLFNYLLLWFVGIVATKDKAALNLVTLYINLFITYVVYRIVIHMQHS